MEQQVSICINIFSDLVQVRVSWENVSTQKIVISPQLMNIRYLTKHAICMRQPVTHFTIMFYKILLKISGLYNVSPTHMKFSVHQRHVNANWKLKFCKSAWCNILMRNSNLNISPSEPQPIGCNKQGILLVWCLLSQSSTFQLPPDAAMW